MPEVINVVLGENTYQIERGATINDLLKRINYSSSFKPLLAKVDNVVHELDYNIMKPCKIEVLDLRDSDGNKAMVSALVFILIASIKDLYGKEKDIIVSHSLDKGLFIETNFSIDEEKIIEIKNKMISNINVGKDIKKVTVNRMDAITYYKTINDTSKVENLKYNTNTYINLYKLDNYYDYFYTKMPINTSYIDEFNLTYINENSFMLNFKTIYIYDKVPEYVHHENMFKVFNECKAWGRLVNLNNASDLNRTISDGKVNEVIRICENKLNSEFLEIAKNIISDNSKKIVLMAGPSSSGKTTSSNKLCMSLRSLGKKPTVISMDDYFKERDETPVDSEGNKDYECLEAMDLELFNKQILALLNNEKVLVPTYNFIAGKKEYKKELIMGDDDILVIEGIHALDNKILENIPRDKKYKIYVSALTELNIDNHNRISTTDNRLLRRIVRDSRTRGHKVEDTIAGWDSVRNGEEKYIFPFQDDCDYTLNTALVYEIGVLKTYVEPLLYSVDTDSVYYGEAKRLINFLRNFLPIPADTIPQDSIIREFIGGSCYTD